ncbi:MAG: hypothetical protein ABI778_08845, partial [Ignavibacteriota bacterium]
MKFPRNLRIVLFMMLISLAGQNASAQWKKIAQFTDQIRTVYFKEFTATPQDGFLSLEPYSLPLQKLWRTQDGGNSWTMITTALNTLGGSPRNFSFKNSLEGWFSNFEGNNVYHTIDGGNSWFIDSPQINIWSIFYSPVIDKLLIADQINTIGIAFSDAAHGIMTGWTQSKL